MSLCSSNPTSDYFDPVTESLAEAAVHKVRNKDLVLPLGMGRDFLLGWPLTSRTVSS